MTPHSRRRHPTSSATELDGPRRSLVSPGLTSRCPTGGPLVDIRACFTGFVTDTLVVHDYLTQRGGGERVALLLAQHIGGGAVTTSRYWPERTFPGFRKLRVSELLPSIPLNVTRLRPVLGSLAAAAFLRHRQEADLVPCSSSGWSHWTATASPTVVYCHTPPRWFWARTDHVSGRLAMRHLSPATDAMVGAGRSLDRRRARRRTTYIANSAITQARIASAYGVIAQIIHPPMTFVTTGAEEPVPDLEPGLMLTIARSRGYKHVEVAVDAFTSSQLGRLVIVGGEPDKPPIRGSVVRLGIVKEPQLRWLYRNCAGVLALANEDFGLTPVEGHAFGRPTVALRAGGYLETCHEGNAV
jgi:glycosyltransferase involved in cell wall biosynthesis